MVYLKNESTVIKLRFDDKCVKFGDSEMDTKKLKQFPTLTLTQAGDCFKFWGLLWKPEL